ncbi:hypothetical protein MANES_05G086408v8 [Manihot esculenta]|uniref:Uncharacterized protein n=1 Tax=Manihot esculenta TaxID=3983 RepID=A0ACB7HMJ8_MANES|nr:hypothetical protein MANES_05G086408v8 [Manihot esculenta]
MGVICPRGKWTWPELVGKDGNVAAAIIEKENENVNAIVIKQSESVHPVRPIFYCGRVRVFVDENGKVISPPTIG